MDELKIGILYIGLHNKFVQKFGTNAVITRKEFYEKIGRFQQLPKKIRPLLLKEMERMKLIERVNRDSVKILELNIDIEKDCNKLYELAGIF